MENGQIVIRPMNYLAMSYDHRIIDGAKRVLSLVAMKKLWKIRRGCCWICSRAMSDRRVMWWFCVAAFLLATVLNVRELLQLADPP